ncbi:kinetochore associated protein 1 [Echinococcus multilocularis]|uniref:Kinetochore associated protein 1 n=1 Tax=Echinococcus multilocularis TaxID=6211 RepID=A0A087W242_ECHMU|nr:kinetochore associated protein 1 [Echinococcus multilocularis]
MVSLSDSPDGGKWYQQCNLFDLKRPKEGSATDRKVFAGNLGDVYYLADSHNFWVFHRNNAILLQNYLKEGIFRVYELSELNAVFIESNEDKLEVFLPETTELLQLPMTLANIVDVKAKSWADGAADVMIYTADSRLIVLSNITRQSFHNAVLNKDVDFFATKLRHSVLRESASPLALLCATKRPQIAVTVSLEPLMKVATFENSMTNMYLEQDLLCFMHLVEHSLLFVKHEYIGSGYFAHQMLIFNAIARVCCGVLCDISNVIDFAIKLEKEDGRSMSFDLYTLHMSSAGLSFEVRTYPARKLHISMPLMTQFSSMFSRNHLSSEPILVEQEGIHLKVSTFLITDLADHLKVLVQEKRFAEARQFATRHNLSTLLISQFEFLACLETLVANAEKISVPLDAATTNMVISDCDSICERAIKLLDDFTVLESSKAIVQLTKSGVIPCLGKQPHLLERVLNKLPQHAEARETVSTALKRLEAFRKLRKYRDLSYISWKKFTSSKITAEFVECFIKWEEYSDGFMIWQMFKTDLTSDLTLHSVNAFLSILSLKPLSFGCENPEIEGLLVETENALHVWLGTELVPALVSNCPSALPLLSKWLVNRVKRLEGSIKSSGGHHYFDWPETAITWAEGLLSKVKPASCQDEVTSQEEVDFLISGLYSRSAEVDPFYDVRCLLFDLITIKDLLDKYNFKLDLDSCGTMDAKSVAFKLMDVAVTSHSNSDKNTSLVDRVANFIRERGLHADSVYCDYCFDLLAAFNSNKLSQTTATFTFDGKQLTPTESITTADLLHRACLVASWITSLDYRCKTAQFLAKVTPMPWPAQLHVFVDSVLADCILVRFESVHAAIRGLLRRSNRAKATSILLRYGVELDMRPGFGLARSLFGLLLHASPPWMPAPCSSLPASRSPCTRQEVLADALQVARLLAAPSEYSADSTITASHTLALIHLRLALHQTLLCPTDHLHDVHQRVHYLLFIVFEEVLTLGRTGGQSFVETLFTEILHDLAALWDVTRCSFECAPLYLEVFACTALEATRLCGPHSTVGKEAAHWLRYVQLGQKILRHLEVCKGDGDVFILHHLPIPGRSDEIILPFAFKHSPSGGPFDSQNVALFNLLLQWSRTEQVGKLEEADVDILFVEAWLTDKPSETVVMVMKQLLERLKMKSEGDVVNPRIAHRFVAGKLMPLIAELAVRSQFDQVAFSLECVRVLLESAFSRGVISSKRRCVLILLSCVTTTFSKISQRFSKTALLQGPFEKWQFSLFDGEEVRQDVSLETAQALSPESLQWLLQMVQYMEKSGDAETITVLISEGLRLAVEYATKLDLVISVSLPMVGALTSLCFEEVYDGSLRVAESSVQEDPTVEMSVVNARRDLMEHLFAVLREHVNQWMSHALGRLFCAPRLDLPLAFGLAVNLPFSTSGSQLRQIVAANPRAANRIQVVASMMFKAAAYLPIEASQQMIEMAQCLFMNAKWDAALRIYGLRLSRRDPRPDVVLGHLLDILPHLCRPFSVTNPLSLDSSTGDSRPLPPISQIVEFCEDFHQDVRQALLKHLEILLQTSFSQKLSASGAVDDLKSFREYSEAKLGRASDVHKALLQFAFPGSDFREETLVTFLKRNFATTSPYDYEQLYFLLDCIGCYEDMDQAPRMCALLEFLQSYNFRPTRDALSNQSLAAPSTEDSPGSQDLLLKKYRLPFHPLCSASGFVYFEKEIDYSNVYKWLKLDDFMKWNLSDNIRIAVVSNSLKSLQKNGLLRLMPLKVVPSTLPVATKFFHHTLPVRRASSEAWEEALACKRIIRSCLLRAYQHLLPVKNRVKLLMFLGETFSRFEDGSIKLMFLKMAVRLISGWGTNEDTSSSATHSRSSSSALLADGSTASSTRSSMQVGRRVSQCIKRALEEAELCRQKLAVEACLHRYCITRFWPDILTRAASSSALVDLLLDKSCLVYGSDVRDAVVAYHRREEVLVMLRGALKELLSLQGVSFDSWARQVLWQRLRLPKSIRPSEWSEIGSTDNGGSEAVDLNATAIIFDLDSSVLLPGEQADLTFNTTITSPTIFDIRKSEGHGEAAEPVESDFLLGEFMVTAAATGGDGGDEVTRILSEWCLLRPLTPDVLQSLSAQEVKKRWRTVQFTLRCRKLPFSDPSVSQVIEYLRSLAAIARQK